MKKTSIFQLYRGSHVLLVEETGVPRENHWPVASHWQTLSAGLVLTTSVVICTDCTGSCQSNYHTIMTMAAPKCPTTIRSWPWLPLNEHLSFSKDWTLQVHDNSNTLTNFDIMSSKYNIFREENGTYSTLQSLLEQMLFSKN